MGYSFDIWYIEGATIKLMEGRQLAHAYVQVIGYYPCMYHYSYTEDQTQSSSTLTYALTNLLTISIYAQFHLADSLHKYLYDGKSCGQV